MQDHDGNVPSDSVTLICNRWDTMLKSQSQSSEPQSEVILKQLAKENKIFIR